MSVPPLCLTSMREATMAHGLFDSLIIDVFISFKRYKRSSKQDIEYNKFKC